MAVTVDLLTKWPRLNLCNCGEMLLPPGGKLLVMEKEGERHVGLMCPKCMSMYSQPEAKMLAQATTEDTVDLTKEEEDPMAEPLDLESLTDDQQAKLVELSEVWSTLVESGVDPNRLKATMPSAV